MSIDLTCEHCGANHQVNDRLAGRRVRCPSCDENVIVPEVTADVLPEVPGDSSAESVVEAQAITVEAQPVETATAVPVSASAEVSTVPVDGNADLDIGPMNYGNTEHAVAHMVAGDEDEDEDEQVLGRGNRPEEEMDMTPMVDVTFLLLIFFMVTAAFSLQKSIRMPRQQTDAPSTSVIEEETEQLDMVELEVDEFGSFLVMAPDWERETPGKQNLTSALREAIAGNKDGMKLKIKVHELAKLHALVDAMDAGTIAGFAELEVTQVDSFD